MPEPKLRDVLSRIARELHDEETAAEFEDLKNRKVQWSDVMAAIRDAPPEARAELREILADEGIAPNGKPPKAKAKADARADDDDADGDDAEPKPPARRRRPGRKSGGAYDWYVDEDSGEIVRSPVAVIYSGEDEPDEVEMLDLPGDDDDAGGDDE